MSLDVYLMKRKMTDVFWSNITHNLTKMADKAGIYQACWRPEEIGATQARDIAPILEKGLADLKKRPAYFRKFNPKNGWGTYDNLVKWVEEYLAACKEHPSAKIKVSR